MKTEEKLIIQSAIDILLNTVKAENKHPIGYNPNGKWTIDSKTGEYAFVPVQVNEEYRAYFLLLGLLFTTREQAEKAAAGKNAMKELVFAIYELSEKIENSKPYGASPKSHAFRIESDKSVSVQFISGSPFVPHTIRMSGNVARAVLDKLGEEKIKLALEWGM